MYCVEKKQEVKQKIQMNTKMENTIIKKMFFFVFLFFFCRKRKKK